MNMTKFQSHIEKCGITQLGLARRLGIKQPAVALWIKRGQIPANRVLAVEAITGLPRHVLRPDIYPPKDAKP